MDHAEKRDLKKSTNLRVEYGYINELTLNRITTVHQLWLAIPIVSGAIITTALTLNFWDLLFVISPIVSMLMCSIAYQLDDILRLRSYVRAILEPELGLKYEKSFSRLFDIEDKESDNKSASKKPMQLLFWAAFGKNALTYYGVILITFSGIFAFAPLTLGIIKHLIEPTFSSNSVTIVVGIIFALATFIPSAALIFCAFSSRQRDTYATLWLKTQPADSPESGQRQH